MENAKKIIFILMLIIISCNTNSNDINTQNIHIEQINSKYIQVKDILYKDKQGNYYLQYKYPGYPKGTIVYGYENKVYDLHFRELKIKLLNDVLNENSFHRIDSTEYFSDNKNIYAIADFATDINVYILPLQFSNYKVVGQYIKDSQTVFWNARQLLDVEAKYFNVIPANANHPELGYDEKYLYIRNDRLSYQEFNSLNIKSTIKNKLKQHYFPEEN